MDSEVGVFSSTFDISSTHIITREGDKTVKVYKNDTATKEIHPVNWELDIIKHRKY